VREWYRSTSLILGSFAKPLNQRQARPSSQPADTTQLNFGSDTETFAEAPLALFKVSAATQ
ncbi:hypothetical protein, partial [Sphingobium psychrophilum]|uniref:hypothetical protein n=1 Tax=Sphingobium psychrophilum TaxID=2728834 RepID=UPI0019D06FCD